jgi:hypothetical protein
MYMVGYKLVQGHGLGNNLGPTAPASEGARGLHDGCAISARPDPADAVRRPN